MSAIGQDEQSALLQTVANALVAAVPQGWNRIRFEFRGTVQISGARFESIAADGVVERHSVPKVAMREFDRLREAMYEPGRGTWFTARLAIDQSRGPEVDFDYDSEPDFNPQLTAGAYALDLRYFPRDDAHTPIWLQDKLREAT
ncbi:hypothetical protein ACFROC_00585 [Nocardia tengchongensis]|uniref:hypothetical protein n=1 Tax=Nocardia tengchongensis TaxID=2055889 RepID=UPI0036A0ACF4